MQRSKAIIVLFVFTVLVLGVILAFKSKPEQERTVEEVAPQILRGEALSPSISDTVGVLPLPEGISEYRSPLGVKFLYENDVNLGDGIHQVVVNESPVTVAKVESFEDLNMLGIIAIGPQGVDWKHEVYILRKNPAENVEEFIQNQLIGKYPLCDAKAYEELRTPAGMRQIGIKLSDRPRTEPPECGAWAWGIGLDNPAVQERWVWVTLGQESFFADRKAWLDSIVIE